MQKSKVNEYIIAQREGKSPEEIAYVCGLGQYHVFFLKTLNVMF